MRYGDVFDRLGELRGNTQQLVKEFNRSEPPEPAALLNVMDTRALGVEMDRLLERLPDAGHLRHAACPPGRVAA